MARHRVQLVTDCGWSRSGVGFRVQPFTERTFIDSSPFGFIRGEERDFFVKILKSVGTKFSIFQGGAKRGGNYFFSVVGTKFDYLF